MDFWVYLIFFFFFSVDGEKGLFMGLDFIGDTHIIPKEKKKKQVIGEDRIRVSPYTCKREAYNSYCKRKKKDLARDALKKGLIKVH